MPEPAEDPEAEQRRARAMRRLTRAFRSTDSYALVLLLIVATYAIAVNVQHRGLTALLLVQIVTVRLALHTSLAHRRVLLVADVLFAARRRRRRGEPVRVERIAARALPLRGRDDPLLRRADRDRAPDRLPA